jgi:hypothetical protein
MDGKTLIHPSQIDPCNEAFTPPAAEVEWARKIVAAFDDPATAPTNSAPSPALKNPATSSSASPWGLATTTASSPPPPFSACLTAIPAKNSPN